MASIEFESTPFPYKDPTAQPKAGDLGDAQSSVQKGVAEVVDRQATLDLLLARYEENLGRGLYAAESAPKTEVEAWLRADPTRLEKIACWEARGGKPMFTGEEDGEFCVDECSAEVPLDIRDICYGPNAAEHAGIGRDRNALTQVEKLGGVLMTRSHLAKLVAAGLIEDRQTCEWLSDPENRDLVKEGKEVVDSGIAWNSAFGEVRRNFAFHHYKLGGLRCQLRGKRA